MKGRILKAAMLLLVGGVTLLSADPIQINETNSNLQLFPKVVQASGGNFVISWCDNRQSGSNFEIYSNATESTVDTIKGGTDDDLSSPDTAYGHRLHVEMVQSNDGAMVAWVDHKDQEVWTIRIDGNGNEDLDFNSENGPVYVHDAAFMTPPEMCSDGAGGLVFASLDSNYQRKLINDRLDRSVSFVWVGDISINIC